MNLSEGLKVKGTFVDGHTKGFGRFYIDDNLWLEGNLNKNKRLDG